MDFDYYQQQKRENLKRDWVKRIKYDNTMDFIIFEDNYIFGPEDIPKLEEALHTNSQLNSQMPKKMNVPRNTTIQNL